MLRLLSEVTTPGAIDVAGLFSQGTAVVAEYAPLIVVGVTGLVLAMFPANFVIRKIKANFKG